MCAAVIDGAAVKALPGPSDGDIPVTGFRGAELPGTFLSSTSPAVLGEALSPASLRASLSGLINGNVTRETESLQRAQAALGDVQSHYQAGVELTARLGEACKSFASATSPSLTEVVNTITACSEMRARLVGENQRQFDDALTKAARGSELPWNLADARHISEGLRGHANLYMDALRERAEARLSGLAIDNDSRGLLDSSLSELTSALKGAGLKTENAANRKRFDELSRQLHASIDDANGLIDTAVVRSAKEEFSKYFEVAGSKLKGWDVFCEHIDRLAEAAEGMATEFNAAKAALEGIGGSIREKPAFPFENVGAGGAQVAAAYTPEQLADLGIEANEATSPDLAEMNGLLRRASHASQGLPPPPADLREDDRVVELSTSASREIIKRGDVKVSTLEYRRGEELVGRDIVLTNAKLGTSLTLRAEFDHYWNFEPKGSTMPRDSSSRELARRDAETAFSKFQSAIRATEGADRLALKKIFDDMGLGEAFASSSPFRIVDRPDEQWGDKSWVLRNSGPGSNPGESYYSLNARKPEHVAAFLDGEVRYRFESRAESRTPGQELQWLELQVYANGRADIAIRVDQGKDSPGHLTMRIDGVMRDANDVRGTIRLYQNTLSEEDGTAKLIAEVARGEIVKARNIDIGNPAKDIKIELGSGAEVSELNITGKTVKLETAFALPERLAELRKKNEFSASVIGLNIDAATVELKLVLAAVGRLQIGKDANTTGSFENCHLRSCSIEGEKTSLSFRGRNTLEECTRSRLGFGSNVIPAKPLK